MKKWLIVFGLAGLAALYSCEKNAESQEEGYGKAEYPVEEDRSPVLEDDTADVFEQGYEQDTEEDVRGF